MKYIILLILCSLTFIFTMDPALETPLATQIAQAREAYEKKIAEMKQRGEPEEAMLSEQAKYHAQNSALNDQLRELKRKKIRQEAAVKKEEIAQRRARLEQRERKVNERIEQQMLEAQERRKQEREVQERSHRVELQALREQGAQQQKTQQTDQDEQDNDQTWCNVL